MKKQWPKRFFLIALAILLISCAATALYFSLDDSSVAHESALITGIANYGSGYYLSSSMSVMEVSLEKVFPAGNIYEISHSRIKNIQRFPVQFTLRYDSSEIDSSCSYRINISFSTDNVNFRKGSAEVTDFNSEIPVTVNLSED